MRTPKVVLGFLFTLLFAVQSTQPAGQNPAQMPDTPAAKQFAAWLEAFGSGDAAAIQAFDEKQTPKQAARFKIDLAFRQRTGGFDFKKTVESAPTIFTALVKERNSDQFAQAVVEVEATAPYRIVDMSLVAVPTPAEFAPPRLTEAELVATLKTRLESDAAAGKFSGAVLVAKGGKPIFSGAYGLAD